MADLTPLQRMNVEEWIGALRSGTYEQSVGGLRDSRGFCCLGVLCEAQGISHLDEDSYWTFDFDGAPYAGSVPDLWWSETTGLELTDRTDLIELNDSGGASFDDIADEIKRRVQ